MPELSAIDPENPAEDVVATLEQALELARKGQISSVAIAMVRRDGVGHHIWSTMPMVLATIGSVERLLHALNRHVDGFGTGPAAGA